MRVTMTEKNKPNLLKLATELVDKYTRPENESRMFFIKNAPYSLSALFNLFGIEAHVDAIQIDKLVLHSGINGAPRQYFMIKIKGVEVEFNLNELHSLATNKLVLKGFIDNFPLIISEIDKIKNSATGGVDSGKPGIVGSVFYSDVSLKLDGEFRTALFRNLVFKLACQYLEKSRIKIWS